MKKYDVSVVENATNTASICQVNLYDKVIAECMKDYLEYRKAEEQGLLFKLPCPIGSEVWKIVNQKDNFSDIPYKIATRTNFRLDMFNEIGKTVFITEKEANNALAELSN